MTNPAGSTDLPRIAVMLYTVDAQIRVDLAGVLGRIADLGYLGVETYGLQGRSPAEVRRALDAAGLDLVSCHAPFPAGDEGMRILEEYAQLGATTLAWSMEREEFDSLAALEAGVVRVNEGARNAAAYGMRIAYHNHYAEFANVLGGKQAYDLLLERLDPSVIVELDLYWTQMGGADPAEVVARLGDRVRLLHVKDGPAIDYAMDVMEPIGQGSLDMPAALSAGSRVEWHIVELERLQVDVFEALRQSHGYLVGGGLSTGRTAPADAP